MELCIENFTPAGNNLMFVNDFRAYQEQMCKSKSMNIQANKVYYDRILNGLTDNRSIDVLNQDSLKNVKKLGTREYIVKYIQENRNTKSIQQMAQALAIAVNVDYTQIYNTVVEEMKILFSVKDDLLLKLIDIVVDGRTVTIEATQQGVTASSDPVSLDTIPSRVRDNETGTIIIPTTESESQTKISTNPFGMQTKIRTNPFGTQTQISGSNSQTQTKISTKRYGTQTPIISSGSVETQTEFVPNTLPPPMTPVTFNREGVPSTNSLETQTTANYPPPTNRLGSANTKKLSMSFIGEGRTPSERQTMAQTAQSGEFGRFTTTEQRGDEFFTEYQRRNPILEYGQGIRPQPREPDVTESQARSSRDPRPKVKIFSPLPSMGDTLKGLASMDLGGPSSSKGN